MVMPKRGEWMMNAIRQPEITAVTGRVMIQPK